MSGRNNTVLVGGLVEDPKVRGNGAVVTMRVGVNRAGRNPDGETVSGYFDCVCFTGQDSFTSRFVKSQIEAGNLKQGSQVIIAGSLTQNSWLNDEGEKRYKNEIIIEQMDYNSSGAKKDDEATESTASSDDSSNEDVPSDMPTTW